MARYHKKVYFPDNSTEALKAFTDTLNGKKWRFSVHTLANLKWRMYNIESILLFIKGLSLNSNDVFEYYTLDKAITKAVYRVNYKNEISLCLVISKEKNIVTIYTNTIDDEHITLDKNIYSVA